MLHNHNSEFSSTGTSLFTCAKLKGTPIVLDRWPVGTWFDLWAALFGILLPGHLNVIPATSSYVTGPDGPTIQWHPSAWKLALLFFLFEDEPSLPDWLPGSIRYASYWNAFLLHIKTPFFLSPATKWRQGNVFTPVCHSVHRGGVCTTSQTHPGRHPLPSACWDTPPVPSACWDTINQRSVRILLECFLVLQVSVRLNRKNFGKGRASVTPRMLSTKMRIKEARLKATAKRKCSNRHEVSLRVVFQFSAVKHLALAKYRVPTRTGKMGRHFPVRGFWK